METKRDVVSNSIFSQGHVLNYRMSQAGLTHGETVIANIDRVRLEPINNDAIIYFCPLQEVDVLERISCGDGGELPPFAEVEGLKVDRNFRPGVYSIKNVKLHSNGVMRVMATEETNLQFVCD